MKQLLSVLVAVMLGSYASGNEDIYTIEDIYTLEEITCTLPRIEGASFMPHYTTYTIGSATKVTCKENRVIIGNRVLRCLPTGAWDGSLPECRLKTTVPPPTTKPDNRCWYRHLSSGSTNVAKARYDPFETVSYKCKSGFVLRGKSVSECGVGGIWLSKLPTCEAGCLNPKIENGFTVPDLSLYNEYFRPGQTVIFLCEVDYIRRGAASARCKENGQWSISIPSCNKKIPVIDDSYIFSSGCPTLTMDNGQISPSLPTGKVVYDFGSVASIICSPGYVVSGKMMTKCQSNGTWSNVFSSCKRGCPVPSFKYGSASIQLRGEYDYYGVGNVTTFICEDGYVLLGSKFAECSEDGAWSRAIPQCIVKRKVRDPSRECESPIIEHGSVLSRPPPGQKTYLIGDKAFINCNEGYSREKLYITCLGGNKWDMAEVMCKVVKPPSGCLPPEFPNGAYFPPRKEGKYPVGTSVTFFCSKEYKRVGGSKGRCQLNGKWSEIPKCNILPPVCLPPHFPHGSYSLSKFGGSRRYTVGATLVFECDSGYKISGSRFGTCNPQRKWSHIPSCRVVPPPECIPPVFPNGSYSRVKGETTSGDEKYTLGTTLLFKCNSGYKILGSQFGTCNSQRKWNQIPSCRAVPPPECFPPSFPHGSYSSVKGGKVKIYTVGTILVFKCKLGYKMSGSQYGTCNPQRKWSQIPTCQAISVKSVCHSPMELKIGSYSPVRKVYSEGSTITWTCRDGYRLRGARQSTCRSNGKFSPLGQKCEVIVIVDVKPTQPTQKGIFNIQRQACTPPQLSKGLKIKGGSEFIALGKEIKFYCEDGYNMIGSAIRICRRTGFEKPPRCERVKCQPPRLPARSQFVDVKDVYHPGDRVEYVCDETYIMRGQNYTVCQSDAQFLPQPPACLPPSCRKVCEFIEGRSCQCHAGCVIEDNCCKDFDQHCRKLFY